MTRSLALSIGGILALALAFGIGASLAGPSDSPTTFAGMTSVFYPGDSEPFFAALSSDGMVFLGTLNESSDSIAIKWTAIGKVQDSVVPYSESGF